MGNDLSIFYKKLKFQYLMQKYFINMDYNEKYFFIVQFVIFFILSLIVTGLLLPEKHYYIWQHNLSYIPPKFYIPLFVIVFIIFFVVYSLLSFVLLSIFTFIYVVISFLIKRFFNPLLDYKQIKNIIYAKENIVESKSIINDLLLYLKNNEKADLDLKNLSLYKSLQEIIHNKNI